jgi:hypothetical protein
MQTKQFFEQQLECLTEIPSIKTTLITLTFYQRITDIPIFVAEIEISVTG